VTGPRGAADRGRGDLPALDPGPAGSRVPPHTRAGMLLPRFRNGRPRPATPARSAGDKLAGLTAGAGALLLPVAMFLPWYREVNGSGGTLSAWDGYWFVIAGMLLLILVGAGLAIAVVAGKPLGVPAAAVVIGFGFLVTITVVIGLFIARPGGNAATAAAVGGFVGLTAINTVKGAAILMLINARKRPANTPHPA
jgi:hypothetical protein